MIEPTIIEGDVAVDDRGELRFVNNFDFATVRRFYMVKNHQENFVRAWHAHRHEGKFVIVTQGAAIIGAVAIDNWEAPNRDAKVHRYILSASKPRILNIPPGYANGFRTLTADTQVMFFSTATMAEASGDDIRYDARHWDIWNVQER